MSDTVEITPVAAVTDVIEPALVDIDGAGNYLAISRPSVRREMYAGRLAAVRYGRKPLFHLSELRRYADSLPEWRPGESTG